jgi:hypothetical protein
VQVLEQYLDFLPEADLNDLPHWLHATLGRVLQDNPKHCFPQNTARLLVAGNSTPHWAQIFFFF